MKDQTPDTITVKELPMGKEAYEQLLGKYPNDPERSRLVHGIWCTDNTRIPTHVKREPFIMLDDKLKKRASETIRGYAAACALATIPGYKETKVKRPPASVEFFKIDEHDDLWGASGNCLYRINDGYCTRYPFDHDAFMALHVLTRNLQPEGVLHVRF